MRVGAEGQDEEFRAPVRNRGQRGVERGRIASPVGAAGQGEVERRAFARAFAALVGMAPVKGIVGARVGVDRGEEDVRIPIEDILRPVAVMIVDIEDRDRA